MREILFRGKRLDNGKWIKGCLVKYAYDSTPYIGYLGAFGDGIYKVDPSTIGQYTGLTANGKKIFEGDIVRHYNRFDDDMAHETGLIFYDSKQCRFKRTSIHGEVYLGKHCRYEVIGNIHDNPELLEGEG